eukprot:1158164-Pelagomonas_calceolata.AAC.3
MSSETHLPYKLMDAEYKGYWGMGTSTPSVLFRISAFKHMRTATLAPSVTKMCCRWLPLDMTEQGGLASVEGR